MKKYVFIILIGLFCQPASAEKLIGDMQTCQGLLDFLDKKLASSKTYSKSDVEKARKGLNAYNEYIQNNLISPRLAKMGEQGSAIQKQVIEYRQAVASQYQKRFAADKIVFDNLMALDNCTKKLMPTGKTLDELKASLKVMIEMVNKK